MEHRGCPSFILKVDSARLPALPAYFAAILRSAAIEQLPPPKSIKRLEVIHTKTLLHTKRSKCDATD